MAEPRQSILLILQIVKTHTATLQDNQGGREDKDGLGRQGFESLPGLFSQCLEYMAQ